MAFDNIPMTRPVLMTAAAALALYEGASLHNPASVAAAADALAEVLRRNLAKLDKAPAAPKAKAAGFRVDLVEALKLAGKVIERRNTIPVLSTVLLTARGDTLTLTATDLDMFLTTTIDAPGVGTWSVCVGAETLTKLVSKGKGEIILAPQEGVNDDGEGFLDIIVGEAVSTLPTLSAGGFPAMCEAEPPAFTMSAPDLARILAFVRPAVSTEATRYYLNGAYFHTVMDQGRPMLRICATDGHRLNLDEVALPEGASMFAGVIVPRKTVDVVAHVLKGRADVTVQTSPQKVSFTCGNVSLTSKVVDGAFPDYMRVIPRANETGYFLDGGALADVVARVSAVSMEKSRSVKLSFGADKVTVSCRNIAGLTSQEAMAVEHTSGETGLEIGFNANYIADAMAALDAGLVTIQLQEASSPIVVRDAVQSGRLCVLMPLRV